MTPEAARKDDACRATPVRVPVFLMVEGVPLASLIAGFRHLRPPLFTLRPFAGSVLPDGRRSAFGVRRGISRDDAHRE